MLFALGGLATFLIGGVTGIFLGSAAPTSICTAPTSSSRIFTTRFSRDVLRRLRRNLFLVPQDVRADDERDAGQDSFLVFVLLFQLVFIPLFLVGLGAVAAHLRVSRTKC